MEQGFQVVDKRGVDGGDQPQLEVKEEDVKNEAPPAVAPKKEKTFVEQCFEADILGRWIHDEVFPRKYTIDMQTGLITNSLFQCTDHTIPWVMVNNDNTRLCDFYKDVERLYGFIPPPCMCCWKVVVMPRTLKELFQLWNIEVQMAKEDPWCFCKCGIELRPDVERNYGGYFYCNDLPQGLSRLEHVKANVHSMISPDVPVLLKRGCTELERAYGPSDKWETLETEETKNAWEKLKKIFKISKTFTEQPELVQKHVMMKWISHAVSIGDPSLPELNGGKKMYPGYVTYDYPKETK